MDGPGAYKPVGRYNTLQRSDVINYVSLGPEVSDDEISAIRCFPTLTELRLSSYGGLSAPQRDAGVTDVQLGEIAKLPSIEWLDLQQTGISDDGIRRLSCAEVESETTRYATWPNFRS